MGATSTAILLLDDGTTIANGNLTIGSGSTLDIENSVTGTGATLDGVNVTNSGTIQVDPAGAETTTVSLVLDGGTTVTGGTLLIHVPGSPAEGIVEIATGGATLDNVTVTNNNILTIDSSATLTLDGGTAINGGTITENGKIDVTGDSSINGITTDNGETTTTVNAILNHGGVTVESGVTLTLDNVTVNGTIFTDLATSSTIQIGSGDTLAFNGATINGGTIDVFGALDSTGISFITGATIVNVNYIDVTGGTLTIDPAPVTNTGTIEVSGDSTLVLSGETITNSVTTADITTKGIIRVDATDSTHFSTLDLEGSTINGGMLNISGVLDSTGDSFITGATITNTGTIDVTSGTLTIDATSTFINTGKLESNGGNLIIDTAFSGNLEIRGDAVLELGAGSPTTYSAAMVTFDPAATGTLKLDHSQVFAGKVVGLDDNTIDLVDISSSNNGTFVPPTVTYSGDSTHGILTIVSNVNSTQVAHIQLTGDYTGVTWAATNDGNGGTSVTEVPGVIAGLDSNGNASEGSPIKASITDGGAGVNATYAWQIFENGGWVPGSGVAGLNGNYTPGETDEGHLLRAFISFVDALGHNETAFVSAGTVNPVAEAGTAAAPEALTLKENDSNVAITGVSVGPLTEDGADTVSAALTIGHGALHVGSLTGVQVTGDDSGTLTVSGDAAAVNTLLQGLTYTPTGEYEGSDQLKLSVTSTDGFSTSATPATASTTIMVNPVAEAAAAAAPSTLTLNENDTGVAITGVSIGPPAEDSDDSVSAALTVGHGALHVGSLTGVQVTGDDSGTLTVSGDAAAVNTLLQGLTYTPTGAYEGSDTLNLSVTSADGLNIYPTPATTSTTITVNPVATGPTEPFIWTAPDNGSWSVGGNWNNGVAPGQSDQAQINSNVTVTIDQDSVAVASLLLDGGATLAGNTLALGSGNTLDVEVGLNGFGGNSDLSSPDVNYPDATLDGVTITAADITTMIEVGISTTGAILTLDDGATIVGGTLKINNNAILDVEVGPGGQGGASGNGDAVLDGVSVQAADNTSTIEVGFTTTGATLTLEDGTTIAGGTLKINSGSILDVEVGQNGFGGVNGEGPDVIHPDATLDGVIVQALDNTSTIEVGSSTSGAILTLDDGTNISNATLTVGSGSTLDIEAGSNGLGATLDGTSVNNSGTVRVDSPILPTTTLTLDDGTTIAGGALSIGSQGVLDIEVGSNGQGNNGADATLDGVQVTNSGSIFVEPTTSGAILTLDDGTTILGGKLTVGNDGSGVLDIEIGNSPGGPANFWGFPDSNFPDATLDGVKVINNGTIDVGLSASGAIVALDDGTTISGGEMNIGGNDILEVVSGSNGAGATLDNVYVSNSGAIQVGVVTEGDPTLTLKNGTTIIDGTLSIGHLDTLDIERGANDPGATLDSVFVNSADSTSMVTLGNGSTLTLTGTTIHGGTVNFVGTGDTLALDTGSRITGKVSGVSNGDTIDFTDVSSNENPSFTYNNETGVLQLDYVATVNGEFIARHEDITLTGSYTQSDFTLSDDGNGGTKVTENLPTINGGPQTASVADGGLWYATGKFTASDPGNDTLTWSIDGGSRYASASYQYGIHEFKVVNGTSTTVFDDTFNGTVPPAGPAILVGSSPSGSSYNDFGSGTYVQGNGEALINGSNAGFVGTAFGANTYGDPVFGQFTTLLTGTSFNAPAGDGLRSGQSFSASGLFDLITPADNNTRYGIRLSDRASLAGANNQPGTETVDLGVIRNGNGTASVLLSELNFETGISTALQVATLNVQPGDNQILLSLSNDAANNGQIHASYTLEKSDGHGGEIADGGRVTLAAVGHIFDNEDWTRPQFYGTSTATTTSSSPQADSVMQGTYGQLDLAQDGAWHYVLNPGLPSVKALAAGQTAQDNFQVTVTNAAGAHSSQTISVTVTGVNDAPVATAPAQYSVFPGAPLSLVNTGLSVSDVDGGSSIETATLSAGEGIITIAAGNSGVSNISGNGTGSVTFSGTIAQINALLNTSSGTVVYADNTVSPSGSTTLTLTIDDNGSNGGSALSGTASSTINLPFGNSDWRHAIDPFAATQGTSTQWIVPNSDGFTSTVFNGGGFTYDPVSHLPTGGGIASINLVSNFGQGILETITGVAVSLGDFGSFIARVESIQSKIPWSSLVEGNNGPTSFSSTDVRFANSDGTFTEIIGNGFVASQNSQPTGTVTSVEQLDAQGNVLHTADFGGGASLGDVASAIFGDNLSQQFYDLAALNHTRLTSFSGAALDDAPGNHTFVGAGQFSSVDFGEATSGVTVNLGTVVSGMLVSGQGTANWGGYHDTLTNILGITGSRFADTITGDNNSNFLDGHGAPSGSHDTLTGGGGSDMFGFQKGYGALTITDFDQGNSGSFSQTENDFIFLNNFASRPTVSYASGNTVLDFGSGDVLTLLNVTQQEFMALGNSEFFGYPGPALDLNAVTSGTGTTLLYLETLPAASIAPQPILNDFSSSDFNGGTLTVALTANGTTDDQLTIFNQGSGPGQIGVSGNTIFFGGVAIGTFSGGASGAPLSIVFNSDVATTFAVQALVGDIQFSTTSSDLQPLPRAITFTVVDGGNNDSSAVATVNVVETAVQFVLTGGNDIFAGNSGHPTLVVGDSSTLNSGDSLVGGGHDALVLENGGNFALNGLSAFSGFSQLILDNFSNNSATVTLGSFVPASVVSGGTGFTYVSNDTVADWNSTAAFSGISQISLNTSGFISPPGSPPAAPVVYDLTHNSFTNVGALSLDGAFGTTTTYLIDSAVASGVSSIFGSFGGLVQLSTSDATLDLSYDNLSGVSVVSTNVTGTTFIVGNAAEASDIFGGPGQDTIQASGFAFTSAQKDAIFASSSIETIVDQSGTYQAPSPDPSVIRLTTGSDTVGPSPDGLTVNATSSTLTSGDSLVGGGHDALVLENGGNFALNGLSAFSGFSQLILDNFSNNSATVTLGSFVPASVVSGGTGFTYVSNDTVADWNSTAAFSGISQISLNTSGFISPPGSPPAAPVVYDLTHNSFTNVGALSLDGAFGTTTTYLIDSAVASGVSSIFGSFGGLVQLSTSDATLDLSYDNLSGVSVVSTNVTGTTFIVGNAAEASDIFGGPGQDTIQASGFAFTSAQKDAVFASSSIETIVDQSGTYQAPPVLHSFKLTVSEGVPTVLTTADFNVTNAQSTDFFSLQPGSVKGGEFEVTSDGANWVSAPTGGPPFSIAEIELGHVRFHPDGTATVPDFSIWVSDGSNASAAIAPNVTLDIATGTNSETISFGGNNGTLLLEDPSHFTGEIAGISGTGEVLDLHGFAAATTTAVTGSGSYHSATNTTTLTVTDLSVSNPPSETFTLAGNLSASSWTVSDDLNGGTNIVDPPATSQSVGPVVAHDPGPAVNSVTMHDPGPASSMIVASAPNQTLSGLAASDTFVFNFAAVGQDKVTNFHPASDTLQFSGTIFANAQAALNAMQDDGHGNTVVAIDAHDTITLSGVLKAQLHVSDFHVV